MKPNPPCATLARWTGACALVLATGAIASPPAPSGAPVEESAGPGWLDGDVGTRILRAAAEVLHQRCGLDLSTMGPLFKFPGVER